MEQNKPAPWDKNLVAIIGTRTPTEAQEIQVIQLIEKIDPLKQRVISGCAEGIDKLALQTAQNLGIETVGCLPWHTYNKEIQQYCDWLLALEDLDAEPRNAAYVSVMEHHPNAAKLRQGALKLHARNFLIIRWASGVIAAPGNAPGGGGTGQGIRLAEAFKIPIHVIKS